MGRQQQFQVLKGVVRQTLLRQFHTSPILSHCHRGQSSVSPSSAAVVQSEKGLGLPLNGSLNPSPSANAPQDKCESLNPKSFVYDPCSQRTLDRYLSSALERNAPSKTDEFHSQKPLRRSPPPLCDFVSPAEGNSLAENYWASALACWPSALRHSRMLAERISFLWSGSAAAGGGGGGGMSRAFATSARNPNDLEKFDEVRVLEGGGVGREGQGGDDGVSASVSGREIPVVKKRRKRKSTIPETELLETERPKKSSIQEPEVSKPERKRKRLMQELEMMPAEPPAKVTSSRRVASEVREERKALEVSPAPPSAELEPIIPKPLRVMRRKRSKESQGIPEKILKAFNENPELMGDTLESNASTISKASSAYETTKKKSAGLSAFAKSRMIIEEGSSVSSGSDGAGQKDLLLTSEPKDASHLSNNPAEAAASIDITTSLESTPKREHDAQMSALLTEPPEKVLQKETVNYIAAEGPVETAAVGTNQVMSAGINSNRTNNVVAPAKDGNTAVNRPAAKVPGGTAAVGTNQVMSAEINSKRTSNVIAPAEDGNPAVAASTLESRESNVDEFSNPQKLYQDLVEANGGRPFENLEKAKLSSIFYRFAVSGWVSDQALSLYINSKFFPHAASRFRKFFIHKSSQELRSCVLEKGATNEALQFLFPLFAEFCIHEFPIEINRYRELVNTADMTKPDAWYPFARAIKRKIVYHKGPTNSGKTYKALQRFMQAPSAIYCSPLRLLAMEVFDTVNMEGVYCNLHTGQEKKDVPFANHLACTVEMCYLTRQWDVAVIDEIQMMSDEYRGWAWTRAFLGLQADEIHVCGDPTALPLIQNICAGTGDELVEYEYERFKPLVVAEESLRGDFRNIEAGDCIVAFSRRDIFDIKREVELVSKHRCCVVYGALPPETRTQQAKLFNEVDNAYNVLVASDAIGMGLNLNIRRVVFFSLHKFDGDSKKPVPPSQVKQIAGRAGRHGSLYPEGVTTTFFSQDLPYLGSSMAQAFEPSTAAGLFPVFEQVELFASQLPNEIFAKLLERFSETCRLDGAFFLSRYDNLKRVANVLEKVKGLSLEDRFNFCFAPVNVRDPQSMGALYRYATAFSQKIPVHVEMGVPSTSARDEFELLDLEARHQVLSMYLWLSQHFPRDLFPQKEQAGEMASQIAVLLGQSLVQSSRRWSKRKLYQQQHRGRPYTSTGRSDSRQGDGWRGDRANPSESLLRA